MLNHPAKNKKRTAFYYIVILGILFFAINYTLSVLFELKSGYIIWSDAEGYYQYLPYVFIKHNITQMAYAIYMPTGTTLNKYTCGVALMEMPFFLLAHLYNKIFGCIDDGYTSVYGMSIWIAANAYVYAALVLLWYLLKKWFGKLSSFIAVACIFYATNLFTYTVTVPGYSHAYGFCILVVFLYSFDRFLKKQTIANTVVCGFAIGLAFLMRPTNFFYVFIFLFYEVYSFRALKERFVWIFKKAHYFLLMFAACIIVFIPQMIYWHAVAGHYILNSYHYQPGVNERFIYWDKPKIGYVLFGVESGWLPYSPVFFLFLAGLVWTLIKRIHHSFAIAIIFILILYANASWWCYTFACSFGHRAMIEYYPVLVIPLAFIIHKTLAGKKKIIIGILVFFLVIFSFLNVRMTQFYYEEVCWLRSEGWTWVNYNKVLNKAFFFMDQKRSVKND